MVQMQHGQVKCNKDGFLIFVIINPEVQYDIARTILFAAGYKYDQSFNNQPNTGANGNV